MKMAGSCSAQMRNGCPLCVRCRDMSSPSSHCANAINLTTEGEPRHRKRSPSPLRWGGFYVAAVASFASPPQRGSTRAEGDGGPLILNLRTLPAAWGQGKCRYSRGGFFAGGRAIGDVPGTGVHHAGGSGPQVDACARVGHAEALDGDFRSGKSLVFVREKPKNPLKWASGSAIIYLYLYAHAQGKNALAGRYMRWELRPFSYF